MTNKISTPAYRWYILILSALTNTMVIALPGACLSVLFAEISGDLHLNLVQVGIVWGFGAVPGIIISMVGGALGDRFGPKRILPLACLLAGLAGASRGLSHSFAGLLSAVFLFGLLTPIVNMNTIKVCGMWFERKRLGLANGALSMGMALGFMLASLLSATYLSPLLGGWRNVLLLYSALASLLCIPWIFVRQVPVVLDTAGAEIKPESMRKSLAYVIGVRKVWLLGLVLLCVGGGIQGMLGYLPLFLRSQGWVAAAADGTSATFHAVSLLCVLPMAILSDRLGSRRKILLGALVMVFTGIGLLAFIKGTGVWVTVIMAGMVRDGFMAVFLTMVIETEGIGLQYAGTATGFVMVFSGVGNLIAPPTGNSLAGLNPGMPFLFWAFLVGVGLFVLSFAREKAQARVVAPAI